MDLLLNVFFAVFGIIILVTGGSFLVKGAASLSRKLGISGFVIGLTIVAYGTSAPELFASIISIPVHQEIVLGNIAGSNIANIGMVAGIMLILGAGFGAWRKHSYEFMATCGTSLAILLTLVDGVLDLFDGVVLCILGIISTLLILKRDKKPSIVKTNDQVVESITVNNNNNNTQTDESSTAKSTAYLIGGIILLWIGATLTIEGSTTLGKYFGLSDHVIGLTVIAIGTSLPELVTSLVAIRKNKKSIGMGNIIGSNIANVVLIGGTSGIISGLSITGGLAASQIVLFDIIIAVSFTVVFILAFIIKRVPIVWGIAFVASYVVWLIHGLAPELFKL